ncbi:MAG: FtsX-like permease family protein [Clostridium sp.]
MESLKLSLLLIKRDIKSFSFYLLSSIINFTILFGIFNIVYDPNLVENLSRDHLLFLSSSNILVIAIVITIGYYSNNFFMDRRKKEIGIQLVSGLGLGSLAFASAMINFLISVFSMSMGFILGVILSPMINNILYSFLGLKNSTFTITVDGVGSAFTMIFINVILLGLLNVGLGYRTEICDLVRSKSGTYKKKKKSKFGNILIIINVLLTVISFLLIATTTDFNVIPIFGALCAILLFFFIYKCLPAYFGTLGYKTTDKINLIVFKNTKLNIEKNLPSLVSIVIISGFMAFTLSEYTRTPTLAVACAGVSILLIFLFVICTLYSFNALALSKVRNFKILNALGYDKKDKEKIVLKETFIFILCIGIFPLALGTLSIIKLCLLNAFNMYLGIFIICAFIVAIIVAYIGSYFIYKKIVVN